MNFRSIIRGVARWWKWRFKDKDRAFHLMGNIAATCLGYAIARPTHKDPEKKKRIDWLMDRCNKQYQWANRIYEGKRPFKGDNKKCD